MKKIISVILAVLLVASIGLNIYFKINISKLNSSVSELSNEVTEAKLGLSNYAEQLESTTAKLEETQTGISVLNSDLLEKEQEIQLLTIVTDPALSRDEKIAKLEAFDIDVDGYIAMLEEVQVPTPQTISPNAQVASPTKTTENSSGNSTGSENSNSDDGWGSIEFPPDDPNVPDYAIDDISDYPWS